MLSILIIQEKVLLIFTIVICLFVNLLTFLSATGIHSTKVFQQLEGGNEKCLMIRPVYPPQCRENEVDGGLEEALVVHGSWKVGDLVDWWEAYCYWSGTVLEVKENESVQVTATLSCCFVFYVSFYTQFYMISRRGFS